jgi:predicted CoA-substrate-specific enzyme activase
MRNAYLGLDVGSISTKGVIIDDYDSIIADEYIWTKADPLTAVKSLISLLEKKLDRNVYEIISVGVTGSARKLIGAITDASVIKNEITSHAIGTMSEFPDVRTIFEIGGQDSKIILIDNGFISDYAMNTLCAAGTGAFLSSQADRLGVKVEEFGEIALTSKTPTRIAARCTVFAETDLIHKAQIGHKKEDIIAGLCEAIVTNYLNNVGKGKKITPPIAFQGGVSKNIGVKKAFEKTIGHTVYVSKKGHLMGALGVAIITRKSNIIKPFDFSFSDMSFVTKGVECGRCANNCEIICVYRNGVLLDSWGNRCEKGMINISANYH